MHEVRIRISEQEQDPASGQTVAEEEEPCIQSSPQSSYCKGLQEAKGTDQGGID